MHRLLASLPREWQPHCGNILRRSFGAPWLKALGLPSADPTSLSPGCRTIGSTSSCGSSGTTPGWPTTSTRTTLWTWTRPCWIPSGNLTCSLPTRRGRTSMRSPLTTNCCGSPGTGTSSTASGGFHTAPSPPSSDSALPHHLLGADPKTKVKQR